MPKFISVKRTPRGSVVSVEEGPEGKCLIKVANHEDMNYFTKILNHLDVEWSMFQKKPHKGWYLQFNLVDLARVEEILDSSAPPLEEGIEDVEWKLLDSE